MTEKKQKSKDVLAACARQNLYKHDWKKIAKNEKNEEWEKSQKYGLASLCSY